MRKNQKIKNLNYISEVLFLFLNYHMFRLLRDKTLLINILNQIILINIDIFQNFI